MKLTGRVIKEVFGRGSKSEYDAVMLETEKGKYVLRRKGGNPFSDPELDRLIGKRIEATGTVAGYTFLISDWQELDESN